MTAPPTEFLRAAVGKLPTGLDGAPVAIDGRDLCIIDRATGAELLWVISADAEAGEIKRFRTAGGLPVICTGQPPCADCGGGRHAATEIVSGDFSIVRRSHGKERETS